MPTVTSPTRSGRGPHWAIRAAVTAACLGAAITANASSHREAPFITEQPKVDATDFYMFRSYEPGRSGFVTLIANYVPLQEPYGGPNYFALDPNAQYAIHVDNDGDGVENLTFQFRFKLTQRNIALNVGGQRVAIPLVQAGQITGIRPATQNSYETYSIELVSGPGRGTAVRTLTDASTGATVFDKPIDNIGTKTIPDYPAYAAQFIHDVNIPGCGAGRVFVGQRKDPFAVNLGETFDLVNIKFPATEFNANAERSAPDNLADANVTTLALEVPISCLAKEGEPVIGAWTTASLRQDRTLLPGASDQNGNRHVAAETGAWVQVSRLGMPLVNEVVIGLKDKDRFNASRPAQDAQFASYVTNPTLPALIEALYGSAGVRAPTRFPRADLVTAFLTGVPGLNKPAHVTPSEMLRLNTTTPAAGAASQNRLGVIGGDVAGFPNGRRPGDDVVDVELRVAMGVLCTLDAPSVFGCRPADAASGAIHFTDGAYLDASVFGAAFPYLNDPIPGSPNGANGLPGGPMIEGLARCVVLAAALCGLEVRAAPFRPANDDTVITTLPSGTARLRAMTSTPLAAARTDADAAAASRLAQASIERARTEGDPRDLGRAQALLAPWSDLSTTPIEILVLQAIVDQSLHQFGRARFILDAVLRRDPRNAQALLTRATVLQVQGDLVAAARDCAALARVGDTLIATTCASGVASLQGRGRAAYVLLDFTLRSAGTATGANALAWSESVLAGIAERNTESDVAAKHFAAALALAPLDRYIRGAYADFLLDHGHAEAALILTQHYLSDDALLLRQALARRLGRADTADATAMLAERFAEARRRGNGLHLREEARFELHLRHDPRRALVLARQNWNVPQREPEDARILLEAARAAGDRAAESSMHEWFGKSGIAEPGTAAFVADASVRRADGTGS